MKDQSCKSRLALVFILLVTVISSAIGLGGCAAKPRPLSLAVVPYEYAALIYVAEAQGFFKDNGLQVTVRDYPSTAQSADALLGGQVDLAATSEFAIADRSLKNQQGKILAVIDKYVSVYLVARKDRGIDRITDLRGKSIGFSKRSVGEYYLGRLLQFNGMTLQDFTSVDLQPADYVTRIVGGQVDAVIVVRSFVDQIESQMGKDNLRVWSAQSNEPASYVIAGRDDWLASHGAETRSFIRGLAAAEDFVIKHPDQAMAIVRDRLRYSQPYIESAWAAHDFSLTLDQSLVVAMENQARWMIKSGLTDQAAAPDFVGYIAEGYLRDSKPEAVSIIR